MKLIVGLGNPGSQYLNTRHNLGFNALNYFQDALADFSPWQSSDRFKALISEGQINNEKIVLAKPQTFMNLSGQAVKLLTDFYKIDPADIWILHDDLDLPLGTLRLSQNGNAAGHNGVASVIERLGTKDFIRFRLGIAPNGQNIFSSLAKKFLSTKNFVLQKFTAGEKEMVQIVNQKTSEALSLALAKGIQAAQTNFN
jgi:PTH1 family peptidyl-tRNA hydrolase